MPPKVTLFAPTPDAFEDQGAPTFKYVLLAMLVTVCLSPLIPITEPRLNCVVNEVPLPMIALLVVEHDTVPVKGVLDVADNQGVVDGVG